MLIFDVVIDECPIAFYLLYGHSLLFFRFHWLRGMVWVGRE